VDRWQYTIVNTGAVNTAERLGMALSYFGERGWELFAIYDKSSNWVAGMEKGFALFKRVVPDGVEPDGPWAEVFSSDEVAKRYKAARAAG
jgi:hypothetical protein